MGGVIKKKSGKAGRNFNRERVLCTFRSNSSRIRRLGVKKIGLFGSAARGEMRPNSDVDVVVEFDKTTYKRYLSLKTLLEDMLGRDVDLLTWPAVQGRLKEQVMKDFINVPTR